MASSMISTITSAIGSMLSGIGSAVVEFFDKTVVNTDGELTTFAIWFLAFLGISFALGTVRFITGLVRR